MRRSESGSELTQCLANGGSCGAESLLQPSQGWTAWPDASDDCLYLSSLAVARFAAGQRLGTRTVDSCAEAARKRGKSIIKLDCWDGNEFLKSYYQGEGFRMLEAVEKDGYFVRLFEKDI